MNIKVKILWFIMIKSKYSFLLNIWNISTDSNKMRLTNLA